jgi:hypothetical protein
MVDERVAMIVGDSIQKDTESVATLSVGGT